MLCLYLLGESLFHSRGLHSQPLHTLRAMWTNAGGLWDRGSREPASPRSTPPSGEGLQASRRDGCTGAGCPGERGLSDAEHTVRPLPGRLACSHPTTSSVPATQGRQTTSAPGRWSRPVYGPLQSSTPQTRLPQGQSHSEAKGFAYITSFKTPRHPKS